MDDAFRQYKSTIWSGNGFDVFDYSRHIFYCVSVVFKSSVKMNYLSKAIFLHSKKLRLNHLNELWYKKDIRGSVSLWCLYIKLSDEKYVYRKYWADKEILLLEQLLGLNRKEKSILYYNGGWL